MTNTQTMLLYLFALLALIYFLLGELPKIERQIRRRMDVYTPKPRVERERCPSCRANCQECDATGRVICRRCGGGGEIILEEILCPGCKGQPGDDGCAVCHGLRKVTAQKMDCPVCSKTGKQACPLCLGTGQESTGRVNRDRPWPMTAAARGWYDQAEPCPRCKGNTFVDLDFKNLTTTKNTQEMLHG